MNDFLQFIRDLSQSRNLHLIAVVVHVLGLMFFFWCYSKVPSFVFLVFAGWSIWYGSQSTMFLLRKNNKCAD